MRHRYARLLLGLAVAAFGLMPLGCASSTDAEAPRSEISAFEVPGHTFNLPAKDLAARVTQALPAMGLSVVKQDRGVIETGYKDYPGEWHIARRWQERTRYRLVITPDYDDPTGKAFLTAISETQTRSNSKSPWYTWAEVQKPERAAELARTLHQQIAGAR